MTPRASDYIRAIVCGWPKEVRLRRLLVMLQGYVDDSGSDGTRAPYVLGAYILPAGKWEAFSDEWQHELAQSPKIEYFKMREAAARENQFAGISEEVCFYKIRKLVEIIKRHNADGVYASLDWNDYREVLEPDWQDF